MKKLLSQSIVLFCAAASLQAATINEDFYYPLLANNSALPVNANGGTGWSGAWQGNTNVLYSTTNLNYTPIPQTAGSGGLLSTTNNYRGITRDFASAATGEIWFSYIFQKGTGASGGLLFNSVAANVTSSPAGTPTNWNVLLDASGALNVTLNGVTGTAVSSVTTATPHLVLGRMITGATGSFSLWYDPVLTGVTSLSDFLSTTSATYSVGSVINPTSITSLGVLAYGPTYRQDAINLSDGNGSNTAAFAAVTGIIPEAGTANLVLMSVALIGFWHLSVRRRQAAL